jgi:hypothetical protein
VASAAQHSRKNIQALGAFTTSSPPRRRCLCDSSCLRSGLRACGASPRSKLPRAAAPRRRHGAAHRRGNASLACWRRRRAAGTRTRTRGVAPAHACAAGCRLASTLLVRMRVRTCAHARTHVCMRGARVRACARACAAPTAAARRLTRGSTRLARSCARCRSCARSTRAPLRARVPASRSEPLARRRARCAPAAPRADAAPAAAPYAGTRRLTHAAVRTRRRRDAQMPEHSELMWDDGSKHPEPALDDPAPQLTSVRSDTCAA